MINVILGIVAMPFMLALSALFGYFFGVVITWIPFISELLVQGLALETPAIPTIMAWIFVGAYLILLTRGSSE